MHFDRKARVVAAVAECSYGFTTPTWRLAKRNLAFVSRWISWLYPRNSYRNLRYHLGNI